MAAGLDLTNGSTPSIETCSAAAIGGTIDTAVDEIDASDLLKGFQTTLNFTGARVVSVTRPGRGRGHVEGCCHRPGPRARLR